MNEAGGGTVKYGGGDGLHTALATHRYADIARRIVGLAVQMRCVAERGNGCVVRIVRLGGHLIAPSREPTERWNARGRLSYKTLQVA